MFLLQAPHLFHDHAIRRTSLCWRLLRFLHNMFYHTIPVYEEAYCKYNSDVQRNKQIIILSNLVLSYDGR